MSVRPPLQPTGAPPVNTPLDTTVEPAETPKAKHPECRLCRDGTYATLTMQSFVGDDNPWDPYCDPCGAAMASVIKDCSQKRDAEIRRLPDPPKGKAAPKVPKVAKAKVEPAQKPAKGSKTNPVVDAPVIPPVAAPKPPVEVRPRMTLAEAMRPTAPKPVPVPPAPPAPVPPPAAPPAPPMSARSAKNALRDAARDVEGYDLLTMLGMKR